MSLPHMPSYFITKGRRGVTRRRRWRSEEYELFKKSWDFQGKDPYYSIHLETNPPDFKLKISDLPPPRPIPFEHAESCHLHEENEQTGIQGPEINLR